MQNYDMIKLEILACRRENTALRFLGNITKYAKATPWILAYVSGKVTFVFFGIYCKICLSDMLYFGLCKRKSGVVFAWSYCEIYLEGGIKINKWKCIGVVTNCHGLKRETVGNFETSTIC
jgi:hypothetical protein